MTTTTKNKLFFRAPSEPDLGLIEGPESIKDLVLHSDNAAWKTGSGDAPLVYKSAKRESEICLMCRMPYGMIVTHKFHKEDSEDPSLYVALLSKDSNEDISLWVGGNFSLFPRAFFLCRELAWEIIRDFCKDGSRSDKAIWMKYLKACKLKVNRGDDAEHIYGEPY